MPLVVLGTVRGGGGCMPSHACPLPAGATVEENALPAVLAGALKTDGKFDVLYMNPTTSTRSPAARVMLVGKL